MDITLHKYTTHKEISMPSGRQQFVVSNIHQPQRLDDETVFLVFSITNDFTKSGENQRYPQWTKDP